MSFWNRRKQIQRPTSRKSTERRDLGTLSPKWDVSIKFLPSGFRKLCTRGGRMAVSARGEVIQENRPAKCSWIETHKNTQRILWFLWQRAQGMHRMANMKQIKWYLEGVIFLLSLNQRFFFCIWAQRGGIWRKHPIIPFRNEGSKASHSAYVQLWVPVLTPMYWLSKVLIYGFHNMSIGIISLLCSFCRIVVGIPLWPT